MRPCAAIVISLLGACESDRERDCERVYAILDASKLHRYDAKAEHDPFGKLRKIQFSDRDVAHAVSEMLSPATGWTYYTPYSTEAPPNEGAIRLAKLCDRPIRPTVPR